MPTTRQWEIQILMFRTQVHFFRLFKRSEHGSSYRG